MIIYFTMKNMLPIITKKYDAVMVHKSKINKNHSKLIVTTDRNLL